MRIIFLLLLFCNLLYGELNETISNVYFLFKNKKFEEVVKNYPLDSLISNKEEYFEIGFDFPYLYAVSYFSLGRYAESLKLCHDIFFPEKYNLTEIKFFNLLMLKEYEKAYTEIQRAKDKRNIKFFISLLNFSKGDTTNGVLDLNEYLELKDGDYMIEALLTDYTFSFRKESFSFLIEEIKKNSLIERDVGEQLISIELKEEISPLSDFIEFRKIMEKLSNNVDDETIKKEFLKLMKKTTSIVLKNLISYEYRKL